MKKILVLSFLFSFLVLLFISPLFSGTNRVEKPILFRGKLISVYFYTNMLTGKINAKAAFFITKQYQNTIYWFKPPEGRIIHLSFPAKKHYFILIKKINPKNYFENLKSILPKNISLGQDLLVKAVEIKTKQGILKTTERKFEQLIPFTMKAELDFIK